MSKAHKSRGVRSRKAPRPRRTRRPVLNCTKVVRLFVVDKAAGRTIKQIRATQNPTGADVFVVPGKGNTLSTSRGLKRGGDLVARSIGSRNVVDHDIAHKQNPGGVVKLSAHEGDQIEWQCDVRFKIEKIEVAQHALKRFRKVGNAPAYPFEKELTNSGGGPSRPIRSGRIVSKVKEPWKQLYKAHFLLKIGDSWKRLDPDFFCGSPSV